MYAYIKCIFSLFIQHIFDTYVVISQYHAIINIVIHIDNTIEDLAKQSRELNNSLTKKKVPILCVFIQNIFN